MEFLIGAVIIILGLIVLGVFITPIMDNFEFLETVRKCKKLGLLSEEFILPKNPFKLIKLRRDLNLICFSRDVQELIKKGQDTKNEEESKSD